MGDVLIIEKIEEECMPPLWWVLAIRETTWKLIFVKYIINVKMMNLEKLNYFYLMVVNSYLIMNCFI